MLYSNNPPKPKSLPACWMYYKVDFQSKKTTTFVGFTRDQVLAIHKTRKACMRTQKHRYIRSRWMQWPMHNLMLFFNNLNKCPFSRSSAGLLATLIDVTFMCQFGGKFQKKLSRSESEMEKKNRKAFKNSCVVFRHLNANNLFKI